MTGSPPLRRSWRTSMSICGGKSSGGGVGCAIIPIIGLRSSTLYSFPSKICSSEFRFSRRQPTGPYGWKGEGWDLPSDKGEKRQKGPYNLSASVACHCPWLTFSAHCGQPAIIRFLCASDTSDIPTFPEP